MKMDWPRVVGRKGRAKIGIRMHDGKQYNEIKRFYDPENTAKQHLLRQHRNNKTYIKDNRRPFLHFGPELSNAAASISGRS